MTSLYNRGKTKTKNKPVALSLECKGTMIMTGFIEDGDRRTRDLGPVSSWVEAYPPLGLGIIDCLSKWKKNCMFNELMEIKVDNTLRIEIK